MWEKSRMRRMRKWYPQATLELRRPLGTMLEMRRLRSVRERDSTSKKTFIFHRLISVICGRQTRTYCKPLRVEARHSLGRVSFG